MHKRMGVRNSERLDYCLGTAVLARIGAEQRRVRSRIGTRSRRFGSRSLRDTAGEGL